MDVGEQGRVRVRVRSLAVCVCFASQGWDPMVVGLPLTGNSCHSDGRPCPRQAVWSDAARPASPAARGSSRRTLGEASNARQLGNSLRLSLSLGRGSTAVDPSLAARRRLWPALLPSCWGPDRAPAAGDVTCAHAMQIMSAACPSAVHPGSTGSALQGQKGRGAEADDSRISDITGWLAARRAG